MLALGRLPRYDWFLLDTLGVVVVENNVADFTDSARTRAAVRRAAMLLLGIERWRRRRALDHVFGTGARRSFVARTLAEAGAREEMG